MDSSVPFVVEKFHVPSKYSAKQLDVELYYALGDPAGKYGDGDVPIRPPTNAKKE